MKIMSKHLKKIVKKPTKVKEIKEVNINEKFKFDSDDD